MKQFLLPESFAGEPEIVLTGEEAHYLINVRRYREGDEFPGRARDGAAFDLRVIGISEGFCRLETRPHKGDRSTAAGTQSSADPAANPAVEVILLPCLLKGKKMDTVIRQAVEAGVKAIHPLESQNCVVKLKEDRQKGDRWRKIVKEAAQQCGVAYLPELMDPSPLKSLETLKEGELGLYFHEKALDINHIHGYLGERHRTVRLIVGPEGGISPGETELLDGLGYRPAYLGTTVLRAETAAIYGLGAVQTILREREQWI